jgi:hypothetical protein
MNQYGLPERAEGFRLSDYDTMSKIVEFVHGSIQEQACAN